ncbi:MAG: hypothetical protein ACP5IE_06070 [Infirmifilum sp.]
MSQQDELVKFIVALMKTYKALEQGTKSLIPDVKATDATKPLYDRITSFKPREENIDEMKRTLVESGHAEILEKLEKTQIRILIGFLSYYGEEGEVVYKAFEHAQTLPECSHVVFEDFSTDSLTVKYLIDKYNPTKTKIITLKRRGRQPGLYTYTVQLAPEPQEKATDALRATLEGSLDIDDLLSGLRVFTPGLELEVVECDPGSGDPSYCSDKLTSVIEAIHREHCQ